MKLMLQKPDVYAKGLEFQPPQEILSSTDLTADVVRFANSLRREVESAIAKKHLFFHCLWPNGAFGCRNEFMKELNGVIGPLGYRASHDKESKVVIACDYATLLVEWD